MRSAAFAIPGDITTLTGGYIYERRLLEGLRGRGHDVQHIELGDTFPTPTDDHMACAIGALTALPPERALILDGLVYGSIDTAGLAQIRTPIVAMIHHPLALETGLDTATKAHLYKTERDNLALASHVLVPSPHTAQILTSDYAVPLEKITIAQPGTMRPPLPRMPTHPPLILSVGILHPRKGHDVLLAALSRLAHLDWRAAIVGSLHDPVYAEGLTEQLHALGLSDRVDLMGRVAQSELDQLYAEATLFTLATRYEGYGIVFDEALVRGLPIVTCATGAVPQTVPEEAGLLVAPDDASALSRAMETLLTDTKKRETMAKAALRAGNALPTWEDTARKASNVLERL
ncbi:glycosyltransferase family 4 protein [Gymnodinialimonas hymeniacidonis]|uniref:glycosyltransferase family 4 protein n=1 Tax=Gymnodinialimonas hymeniacidonis TaxID=3126508 RepID=UPI0034C629A7